MKTKKSVLIIGLVAIAVIAAGTVIGVSLSNQKQKNPHATTIFLTELDHNTSVSLKVGDAVNLTLPDYGDGGYVWEIITIDVKLLSQTDYFNWGSSGLLGDFGKDTWMFTALLKGSTTLELQCQRPFGEQDICQTFKVTIDIV